MKRSPQEPSRPDEQERGLQALADLMRAGAVAPDSTQDRRRRFLQTWQQQRGQPQRRLMLRWAPLAAACALAMVVGWQWHTTHAVLQVVATRGGTSAEPSVGAMMPEGTELRFSEGTVARVKSNSRAMVSRLDSRGATVTLAEGSLHLKVVKHPDAAWRVEAGPYLVQVTGTQFDVHWNESRQRFQIDLHEGSVSVSGPSIGSPQKLTAGHTLRIDGQDAPMTITPVQAAAPPSVPVPSASNTAPSDSVRSRGTPLLPRPRRLAYVAPNDQVAATAAPTPQGTALEAAAQGAATEGAVPVPERDLAPTAPAPTVEPSPIRANMPPASWPTLLQAGDFGAVVAEAERLNVDAVVAARPLVDLQALADASRYTGNAALARKTLQALRKRFAQTPAAQKAAFELGRLEDDHAHAPGRAIPWYVQYLSDSPNGAFAEDALVRLMMAHVSLKQHDQAALHAHKYMQTYPTGGHSELAKKILRSGHTVPR